MFKKSPVLHLATTNFRLDKSFYRIKQPISARDHEVAGGKKKGNIAIFVGGRISKRCTIFHATRRGGIITWLQMGVGILKIDKRQIERGKQMDKFVGRNPSLLNIS